MGADQRAYIGAPIPELDVRADQQDTACPLRLAPTRKRGPAPVEGVTSAGGQRQTGKPAEIGAQKEVTALQTFSLQIGIFWGAKGRRRAPKAPLSSEIWALRAGLRRPGAPMWAP